MAFFMLDFFRLVVLLDLSAYIKANSFSGQTCANIDEPCTVNAGSGTNGATCADGFGWFPCTCLSYSSSIYTSTGIVPTQIFTNSLYDEPESCVAIDSCVDSTSFPVTGTSIWTDDGGKAFTQNYYSGSIPPVECSDGCYVEASRVRILFWPVEDNNTTMKNFSGAAGALPYTTVSDGFTFTSPSVYVAYENLVASTNYLRFGTETAGRVYNTTVAYKSEALSTALCFHHAQFSQINYTLLQNPPPNSFFTNCFEPGYKSWNPANADWSIGASPIFSYPQDVTRLVPSWSTCELDSIIGVMDPPRTLNPATAMVPVSSSSPVAAPAAHISPANAPATPTPSPKDPQGSTPNSAASPVDPGDPGSSSDPKASSKAGNPPDPQQPGPQNANDPPSNNPPGKNDPPNDPPSNNGPASNEPPGDESPKTHSSPSNNSPSTNDLPTNNSPINNPPSNNNPSTNDPPTNNSPMNNSPSNNNPSSKDPATNSSPSNNNPSINDPPSNKDPANNAPSNANDPASNDSPSENGPPADNPSKNVPTSVDPTPISASPPANVQPQGVQNQSPSSAATNGAAPGQAQGIGAQIANAFGYVPDATASPASNPNVANHGPEAIEAVVNGSPSPVMVGGATVQKVSNGAMLVAGQTVPQGSQATVSGVVISVGKNGVAVDGTNHAFSPLASETPVPLIVGGNTAQRAPNGGLVVASQTLAPGAHATVAGVVVSFGSDNAILDGTTHNLAPITPTPVSVIVNGVTTALQPAEAGASQAPVINVGGQDITFSRISPSVDVADQRLAAGSPGQGSPYIVAGQTLTPGGAAITVSGTPISLSAAQTLAGNIPAIAIEAPATQAGGQTPVTIGNLVFTPNPSAFAIAGSTLTAGAPGVTIAGTLVSLQPSGGGLVIGSSTLALVPSAVSPESLTPVTIGSQVFTPNPSAFAIAGTTISAGGPGITVAGTVVSLQPSGAGLVVGSNTLALATASPTFRTSAITLGNQVFTPNPTGFSIAGTTISAGGPGITVAGTVVSLQPSGAGLIVGSSTFTLATASHTFAANAMTVGNQVFTPNPTGFSIAGTTISAGGQGVTIDGTVVSLASDGSALVVGSSTLALNSPTPTPGPITIGSQIFTPNPDGFSIAGTTISAGGQGVTIDGTVVSLESLSGRRLLFVGSSTIELVRTTAGTSVPSVTSNPGTDGTNTTSTAGSANPTSSSTSGATTGGSLRPPPASSSSQRLSLREQGGLWSFISIALLAVSSLIIA